MAKKKTTRKKTQAKGDTDKARKDAFDDLQEAIELADTLDRPVQIWVAGGFYIPTWIWTKAFPRSVTPPFAGKPSFDIGQWASSDARTSAHHRLPPFNCLFLRCAGCVSQIRDV